jgi:toxin ParE1/3/4
MGVVWLHEAVENLKQIRIYISKDKPQSAKKVAQKIKKTIFLIKDNPSIGMPSLLSGFREMQVAGLPYVIPYKVSDNKIIIVRIFHNKQNIIR